MRIRPDDVPDPFSQVPKSLDEAAEVAEAIQLAALRAKPREVAIERGRRFGENEADRRGELGREREVRVKRAMAYAAWEYDGKPLGVGDRYQKEFGLGVVGELQGALQRGGSDMKRGKK